MNWAKLSVAAAIFQARIHMAEESGLGHTSNWDVGVWQRSLNNLLADLAEIGDDKMGMKKKKGKNMSRGPEAVLEDVPKYPSRNATGVGDGDTTVTGENKDGCSS
ncbi:hypothetical protein L1887_39098 [Cichorium endivia]|nr:hypothetical protein L1887_39098 [Cichorium endivia]